MPIDPMEHEARFLAVSGHLVGHNERFMRVNRNFVYSPRLLSTSGFGCPPPHCASLAASSTLVWSRKEVRLIREDFVVADCSFEAVEDSGFVMVGEWTSVGEWEREICAPNSVCIKVLEKTVDDALSSILVIKSGDRSRGQSGLEQRVRNGEMFPYNGLPKVRHEL